MVHSKDYRHNALIAVDRDSLFGYSFTNWVLYDLPAGKQELPEGLPKQEQLPDGSRQGLNDFDNPGYVGPCPPGKSGHRYAFTLYALDSKLNLPAGATRKQVEKALKGHVLAHGELIGRYPHQDAAGQLLMSRITGNAPMPAIRFVR